MKPRNPLIRALHHLAIAAPCLCAATAFAQAASFLKARPDFQNQLYLATPTNAPGTSLAQPQSIALFSGSSGDATNATNAAPNNALIFLTRSGIGQSFFAANAPLAAPTVVAFATNPIVVAGQPAVLSIVAAGTEPVTYQWFLNGVALAGATNAALVFNNAQPALAGNYAVTASNALGVITSPVATLSVETTFVEVGTAAGVSSAEVSRGAAWGDFNNDGFLDLVIATDVEELLYGNNGNGTFTLVTNSPVTAEGLNSYGVAWGDYNNDGWLDLFVANRDSHNELFINNGNGTFTAVANGAVVTDAANSETAAWADYDGDGFLDLFVGNADSKKDFLYHNNRNGTFTKVTDTVVTAAGVDSAGAAWGDFDGDGRPDLFVAGAGTSGGMSFLFRNTGGGGFTFVTNEASSVPQSGAAVAWGDYDNDGDPDLLLTTQSGQGAFLYRNDGGTNFTKVWEALDENTQSCAWTDYDNDGWLDVFIATAQTNLFLRNMGDGTFRRITTGVIATAHGEFQGAAWGDYDNDGFPDLIVTGYAGTTNRLFHNSGNSNAWLKVRCQGVASNRSAIGAKVRVLASINGTNRWQMREISGGSGSGCQNSLEQIFGLGDATNVIALRVEWPSGKVTQLFDVAARQILTVSEPVEVYAAVNGRGTVTISPQTNQYLLGQMIALTATPRNTNWTRFLRWSDGNTNATRSITVGFSNVFTAVFTNFVTLEELVFKQWDRSFGASGSDNVGDLVETPDGGFLIAGSTERGTNGNKSASNFGFVDGWAVRLDAQGNKLWDRTFGGTNANSFTSVIPASDGGFVLGGHSDSPPSGNKTSPALSPPGLPDAWAVRIDHVGDKLWDRSYGGNSGEQMSSMAPAMDGGFVMAGQSASPPSGTKTSPQYGGEDGDFWVMRSDAQGNQLWERSFGGTETDSAYGVEAARDGGWIVCGRSESGVNGNKTGLGFGASDYWVVRLDAQGNLLWDRSFGGDSFDEARAVRERGDGNLLVAGRSQSGVTGNKTATNYSSPFPSADAWLIGLDSSGNKVLDFALGGTDSDDAFSMSGLSDGGFILGGNSSSTNGTRNTPIYGLTSVWLARLDANGRQLWDYTIGGTNIDQFSKVKPTSDGGFVIAVNSYSPASGTKTAPSYGNSDVWVIRLSVRAAPVGTPAVLVNGQYSPSNEFVFYHTNNAEVTLTSTWAGATLYYTYDGSDPDFASEYVGPFHLDHDSLVRVVAYRGAERAEEVPVVVRFIPDYTLTATTPGGGGIGLQPPPGPTGYTSNTLVTLTATSLPGWMFVGWSGDVVANTTNITVTLNTNKTLQAIFATGLTTNSQPVAGGGIVVQPAQALYPYGTPVRVSAVPAAGRYFNRWTLGSGFIGTSPLTLLITNANTNVVAQFGTLTGNNRSLTVLVEGGGSVSENPDAGFYPNLQSVTLTATPDSGYLFAGWSGDASSTATQIVVTMNASKVITATFVPVPTNSPPAVSLTAPTNGAAFIAPASISLSATAGDSDGVVTSVAFYNGMNLIGLAINGLAGTNVFSLTWSNAAAGAYTLTAVATDNAGLASTSVPVNITMISSAVFAFGQSDYSVNESNGSVTVTVTNRGDLGGSVNYTTVDGTAHSGSGFSGDFTRAQGFFTFANGQRSTNIVIGIRDNYLVGADVQFQVQLSNPGPGILGNQSNATVTIHLNDVSGPTNSLLAHPFPSAQPPTVGSLTVTLIPPEAGGQWRFPWDQIWRTNGDTVLNLEAGNYPIEFRAVSNYLAFPPTLTVVMMNGPVSVTHGYLPTLGATDQSGTGALTVNFGPNPPVGAGWRFLGEGAFRTPTNSSAAGLLPDTYFIEFAPVSGRVKPASRAVPIVSGQETILSENYLSPQPLPPGVAPLGLVQHNQITDPANFPFCYNGQLQSDAGYGSGVAVRESVVLTAAHLVFNDATLTYANDVYWYFQRETQFEPEPLAARGWYVLGGYAAQRTNDLQPDSGYGPGASSPASRELDVAALYFSSVVARGGYGGYLLSDAIPNPLLTGSNLKMLVGYPVDGSAFGQTVQPGWMYSAGPQSTALTLFGTNVYTASWFVGYPGNSGGPVYVLFNNYYYPAAVYLGTLGSGQNSVSVVRAITSDVANLINLASSQGDAGTNNTGGGVITLIAGQASKGNPAYIQVRLAPPAAVRAGAGWRLQDDATFSSSSNYIREVTTTNTALEFNTNVSGWNAPTNRTVQLVTGVGNLNVISNVSYTVQAPRLVADPTRGIGIVGTTDTTYQIQFLMNLNLSTEQSNWQPLKTNTLGPGFNFVTNGPGFYRARWLGF